MSGDDLQRYRVLPGTGPSGNDQPLFLDPGSGERTTAAVAAPDLPIDLAALRPGYLVEASLSWQAEPGPAVEALSIDRPTLFAFRDGATNLFEEALDAWEAARREGLAINARTTYGSDRRPNGALYTIAEQAGERDVFAEIRDGRLPLDPLLAKVDEGAGGGTPGFSFDLPGTGDGSPAGDATNTAGPLDASATGGTGDAPDAAGPPDASATDDRAAASAGETPAATDPRPPREVFVLRPRAHEFVLVYIVLSKGSILADTVRETYDCPRPDEPALD